MTTQEAEDAVQEQLTSAVSDLERIYGWLEGHSQQGAVLAVRDKISSSLAVLFHGVQVSPAEAAPVTENPVPVTPILTDSQETT